ncbi:MoaD/ThiS family protein [Candidatus Fermentibacteria bacterium]|nr:MoaD/ThiS family protein [Candidatus Fermentibacteria bacterium]
MQVTIKLFAMLKHGRFDTAQRECLENTTIQNILDDLAIPPGEAAIIFRNGRHAAPKDVLQDNDAVSIFPPIGGG